MKKRNRKKVVHQQVADDLDRWAKVRSVQGDPYVVGLSGALRTGKQLSFWALHSPLEWLPRPRSSAASKVANWARLISVMRNVLIFLPVAITWYAIGQATQAFNIYLNSGAETTANFLEFWQDGKGILAEKWRIGNVATLDFQLILCLVILTFFAGVLQSRSLKLSNKEIAIFEKERVDLSLRIENALYPFKVVTEETNSQALASLLDRLDGVTQNLGTVGEELIKAAKTIEPDIKKSLAEIRKTSNSVSKAATQIQKSTAEAQQTVKQLKASKELKVK